jgi:hypothetical protein
LFGAAVAVVVAVAVGFVGGVLTGGVFPGVTFAADVAEGGGLTGRSSAGGTTIGSSIFAGVVVGAGIIAARGSIGAFFVSIYAAMPAPPSATTAVNTPIATQGAPLGGALYDAERPPCVFVWAIGGAYPGLPGG